MFHVYIARLLKNRLPESKEIMTMPDKRHKKILGKLIRQKEFNNKRTGNENEFDATKPSVLIWITIAYIAIVFFLIIGVPWRGSDPAPILPEDLPVAISVFVLLYIVIVGGLYLRDKLKKK